MAESAALNALARVAVARFDVDAAVARLAEAAHAAASHGLWRQTAICRNNFGALSRLRGDYGAARASFDAALDLLRAHGDRPNTLLCSLHRATLGLATHDEALAGSALADADVVADEVRNPLFRVGLLLARGEYALHEGDLGRAKRLFDEARSGAVALRAMPWVAEANFWLGRVSALAGVPVVAFEHACIAVTTYCAIRDAEGAARSAELLACAFGRERPHRLRKLRRRAENLRAALGAPRTPADAAFLERFAPPLIADGSATSRRREIPHMLEAMARDVRAAPRLLLRRAVPAMRGGPDT